MTITQAFLNTLLVSVSGLVHETTDTMGTQGARAAFVVSLKHFISITQYTPTTTYTFVSNKLTRHFALEFPKCNNFPESKPLHFYSKLLNFAPTGPINNHPELQIMARRRAGGTPMSAPKLAKFTDPYERINASLILEE